MGGSLNSGYLLDTHALLFAAARPNRLSPKARAAILSGSRVHTPSASAWEIATEHRMGKLPEAGGLLLDYRKLLGEMGLLDLPIHTEHALLAGSMVGDHRDLFDRILAAQARLENLTIISADPAFDALGVRRLW
ncbi:type II toxin-antitoxin system VapC family toxin [Oceanithermus sp.]|uniref:type II toxin-antitoxin system VapC family toxin n=1 Tax=Oceanithermus sp. TaxID=2268145 RepID=UPI0025F23994|nr:type II toxin-antitoxin system VapC family toxin [Oceanithermus sp.]